jgi:radical SAM protein (TIGR01212 family)
MTFPWGHERRFNSFPEYFRKHYGERVQKLTIDAGFTCPNRDGTVGRGGCAYCNNDAFNPSYCSPQKSIRQQLLEGIEFHRVRYRRAEQYLAYFQAYSGSYAPLDRLRELYGEALSVPDVIGIVIGTRPDCVDSEKLDYMATLSRKYYVAVEYGMESCSNSTLKRVNRGHTVEQCIQAIEETSARGIRVGTHLIFGLPGETRQEMLNAAAVINRLPVDTVKLHQLQIAAGTAFAGQYASHPEQFNLFGRDEYIDFVVQFLERLNPKIVVERFAGEMPPRYMASPGWGLIRNVELWRMLEKRMEELDTWQGKQNK